MLKTVCTFTDIHINKFNKTNFKHKIKKFLHYLLSANARSFYISITRWYNLRYINYIRQKGWQVWNSAKSPHLDTPNGPSEILQAQRAQPDFPTLTVWRESPTRVSKNKQIYRNPHHPLSKTNPESWINPLAGLGTMLKENCPTPDQLDSPETFKVKGKRKKTGPCKFLLSSEFNGTVARKESCNLESSSLVLIEDNFSFVLITS